MSGWRALVAFYKSRLFDWLAMAFFVVGAALFVASGDAMGALITGLGIGVNSMLLVTRYAFNV